MDKTLFRQLNQVYAPLRGRAIRLTWALAESGMEEKWGWYANHSMKVDGEYQTGEFPIPVIDVGSCARSGSIWTDAGRRFSFPVRRPWRWTGGGFRRARRSTVWKTV